MQATTCTLSSQRSPFDCSRLEPERKFQRSQSFLNEIYDVGDGIAPGGRLLAETLARSMTGSGSPAEMLKQTDPVRLSIRPRDLCESHQHVDLYGSVHDCWHECKSEMKRPAFWVLNIFLTFLLFPFEHALYTHVTPFAWVSKLLGVD